MCDMNSGYTFMFSRYFGVTIPIKGQSEECESTQRSLNQQVMTAILEKNMNSRH